MFKKDPKFAENWSSFVNSHPIFLVPSLISLIFHAFFFSILQRLKYHTQVTVRSTRGKNARGRKISGIEPMPGEDKVNLVLD